MQRVLQSNLRSTLRPGNAALRLQIRAVARKIEATAAERLKSGKFVASSYHHVPGMHDSLLTLPASDIQRIQETLLKQLRRIDYLAMVHWMSAGRRLEKDEQATPSRNDRSDRETDTKGDRRAAEEGDENEEQDEEKRKKKEEEEKTKAIFSTLNYFSGMILVTYLLFHLTNSGNQSEQSPEQPFREISWNEFVYDMLARGEVHHLTVYPDLQTVLVVLHPDAVVRGKQINEMNTHYKLRVPEVSQFEEKLRKVEDELGIRQADRVQVTYHKQDPLFYWFFAGVLVLLLWAIMRSVSVRFLDPSEMFKGLTQAKFIRGDRVQQKQRVSFAQVAGLKEAKMEVMEFVEYLKDPGRFQQLGARVPRGVLLLGPPGCGKTLLAKALASEARVPFFAIAGSEFIEMIGGLGASRVRDLFKEAKKQAPCIIYIDEIDTIGKKRSDMGSSWAGGHSEEEHTLNQLLVEMDGMHSNDNVIVLASTNRAEVLDPALLRPGRLDRHILIDFPTLDERRELFQVTLKHYKLAQQPAAYVDRLAQLTTGMTGADIVNVCNEAALHAARQQRKQVDQEDLEYAVERVLAGVAKISHTVSELEKRIIAYREAGRTLLSWLLPNTDAPLRVSIVPRTNSAVGYAIFLPRDRRLHSDQELFDRMCASLGGACAEKLVFAQSSSMSADDLKRVTQLAYDQVQKFGMSPLIGPLSFDETATVRIGGQSEDGDGDGDGGKKRRPAAMLGRAPYSRALKTLMDAEAKRIVEKAFAQAEKTLKENRGKLELLAKALIEREVLMHTDIESIIGPSPHGKKRLLDEYMNRVSAEAAAVAVEKHVAETSSEKRMQNDGLHVQSEASSGSKHTDSAK